MVPISPCLHGSLSSKARADCAGSGSEPRESGGRNVGMLEHYLIMASFLAVSVGLLRLKTHPHD
jgi:hypothetical protein